MGLRRWSTGRERANAVVRLTLDDFKEDRLAEYTRTLFLSHCTANQWLQGEGRCKNAVLTHC